jgi:hypothetical protein
METATLNYGPGPPIQITQTLTVSAPTTNLVGATVAITSGFVIGEYFLDFTNQNGISSTFDGPSGTLTLTGTASVADYQTALRSVMYEDRSGVPHFSNRYVAFQVDDGTAPNQLSNVQTRTINVHTNCDPVGPIGSHRSKSSKNVQAGARPQC